MYDILTKVLEIPAARPGNFVGYEIDREERPYVMQEEWLFQTTVPVRESHYKLQLPSGWEYKAVWMNHPEVAPAFSAKGQTEWVVSDVKPIQLEEEMPPSRGIPRTLFISLFPPRTCT